MLEPRIVPVPPAALEPFVGAERVAALSDAARRLSAAYGGCTIWNVNSTASGGGVAEMLAVDLAYVQGAALSARWLVIEGDPAFFTLTKRLHNRLHGARGDGGPLGAAERAAYEATTARNAEQLLQRVKPDDVVVLHDPQTAGLVPYALARARFVVWRCHVGRDTPEPYSEQAWEFLRPYVEPAPALVFSRTAYAPKWADPARVAVIAPAIDPYSVKNRPIEPDVVCSILDRAGIIDAGASPVAPGYERVDGTIGVVTRQAELVREGPPPGPDTPLVVQVSRWDRLKDMAGVLRGFAYHNGGWRGDAAGARPHLVLAGPSVRGVADDPEGAEVLAECVELWRAAPPQTRRSITLASLPMDDPRENAAIVNALQRHAAVVVQKSLVEGFGLTAAEAMWKARPVVVSAVGGLADQVVDGLSGVLLPDPTDLAAFGAVLQRLLADPARRQRLGDAARRRVRDAFLPDRQLRQWAELLESSAGAPGGAGQPVPAQDTGG